MNHISKIYILGHRGMAGSAIHCNKSIGYTNIITCIHIELDNITFQTFAVLTIFIFAISIIPVSLGGLGIKEMSAIVISEVFGFDTNLMAAAVIVDRIVFVGTHTITGLPYLIQYIDILKIKETQDQ